jgi:hypothetical protein
LIRLPAEVLNDGYAIGWCFVQQIHPRGDRVLVKVAEEETKTRGGILLPTSAIKKPTSGEDDGAACTTTCNATAFINSLPRIVGQMASALLHACAPAQVMFRSWETGGQQMVCAPSPSSRETL